MYYGHLGTNKEYSDYQGVLIFQVSLCDKTPFGTITKRMDYAGVLIIINCFSVQQNSCFYEQVSL